MSGQSLHPALQEHPADPRVESVLFVTDGGRAGAGALEWLAARAVMHRLDITVITVVELDWASAELSEAMFERAAGKALDEVSRQLARTAPQAMVRTEIRWGDARTEVGTASEQADLLVVGSNRTGRLSRVLGGSFSTKLAEAARCPAVIVPRTWRPEGGPVVVGVQGDGSDEEALRFAAHEALVLHRPLRLVHAWQFPPVLVPISKGEEDTAELVSVHDALLVDVMGRVRREFPHLDVTAVLAEGHPADALTEEATDASLLVLGTHGYTVTDRFFLGSVSRDVIGSPSCPTAVVRPSDTGGGGDG